jgi:hypothetical protein
MRLVIFYLFLLLNINLVFADDYTPQIEEEYQKLALTAEGAINQGNFNQGIDIYIRGLNQLKHGRIHLRLGQLFQKKAENSSSSLEYQEDMALAFYHYSACISDPKLDALDKKLLCINPFENISAPLYITGKYKSLWIEKPTLLKREFISGSRLPKGEVELKAVDADTQIEYLVKIKVPVPKDVYQLPGPPNILPSQPVISNDFISNTENMENISLTKIEEVKPEWKRAPKITGIVLASIGGIGMFVTGAIQHEYYLNKTAHSNYLFPSLWTGSALLTLVGSGLIIFYF